MEGDRPDTRATILQAAYGLFYARGFARVSVDAIAARAGVTKRTVYYHFESKDDVIAEVLVVQHRHLMQQFAGWVGPETRDREDVIRALFGKLKAWADAPSFLGSGFSRVTAELADLPGHPARGVASRHKAAVETWLAERLTGPGEGDAGRLAREIMILIEGSMSLALVHGDTDYILEAEAAALRFARAPKD